MLGANLVDLNYPWNKRNTHQPSTTCIALKVGNQRSWLAPKRSIQGIILPSWCSLTCGRGVEWLGYHGPLEWPRKIWLRLDCESPIAWCYSVFFSLGAFWDSPQGLTYGLQAMNALAKLRVLHVSKRVLVAQLPPYTSVSLYIYIFTYVYIYSYLYKHVFLRMFRYVVVCLHSYTCACLCVYVYHSLCLLESPLTHFLEAHSPWMGGSRVTQTSKNPLGSPVATAHHKRENRRPWVAQEGQDGFHDLIMLGVGISCEWWLSMVNVVSIRYYQTCGVDTLPINASWWFIMVNNLSWMD